MTETFIIDPTTVSQSGAKSDVTGFVQSKPDFARWADFFASSTGQTKIEIVAGLSALLSYNNIISRREAFWTYARARSSVTAGGQFLGYSVFRGSNVHLRLTITPNITGTITRYSIIGVLKDKDLIALEDTTVNAGVQTTILAAAGDLRSEEKTVDTEDPDIFRYTQDKVSNDVRVLLNDVEVEISDRIRDLNEDKFAVVSNVNGAVDVIYMNDSDAKVRYAVGDVLKIEYLELKDIEYSQSDINFIYGTLNTYEVDNAYTRPETIKEIKVNAPLFHETQKLVEAREDYAKVFKFLRTIIADTNWRDISPAVIELTYSREDMALFGETLQVIEITSKHDDNESLQNKYLYLYSTLNNYYLWINVDGTGSDPNISGKIGLEVTISKDDVAETVAAAVKTKLDTVGDFDVYISGKIVTVYDTEFGVGAGTSEDINTGFTVRVATLGNEIDSILNDLLSRRTMGLAPPTITHPIRNPVTLDIAIKLLQAGGNPENDIESIISEGTDSVDIEKTIDLDPFELTLEKTIDLTDLETAIEALAYIKTTRIQIHGDRWEEEIWKEQGSYVVPKTISSDFVFRLTRVFRKSGLVEPTWPLQVGEIIEDNNVVWRCEKKALPFPGAWVADTDYALNDLAMPSVDNRFMYRMIDQKLYSNTSLEIQKIVFDVLPASGTWRIHFGDEKTSNLAWDATDADVQSALRSLNTLSDVVVSVLPGPEIGFLVEFEGDDANKTQPEMEFTDEGINEIQSISADLTPDAGNWKLTFDGQETGTLAFNILADDLKIALEALSNIDEIEVTGAWPDFTITFKGVNIKLDVVLLIDSANTLVSATPVTATPSTTTEGRAADAGANEVQDIGFSLDPVIGQWSVTYDTKTTVLLGYDATFAQVQAALEALPNIGAGNVVVTGTIGQASGFEVTFQGALALIDVPQMTVAYNSLYDQKIPDPLNPGQWLPDGQQVAIVITTDTDGRPVDAGQDEEQKVEFDYVPDSGVWRLTFDSEETADIAFNDNAAAVQSALEALTGVGAGDIVVSGDYSAGFTFAFQSALALANVPEMTVSASTLAASSAPITLTITEETKGEPLASNLKDIGVGDVTITPSTTQDAIDPEPIWPTTEDETVYDKDIVWIAVEKSGDPAAWQPGTRYRLSEYVLATDPVESGTETLMFQCMNFLGNISDSEPTWPSVENDTVRDGNVEWAAKDPEKSPDRLGFNEYYNIEQNISVET